MNEETTFGKLGLGDEFHLPGKPSTLTMASTMIEYDGSVGITCAIYKSTWSGIRLRDDQPVILTKHFKE